LESAIPGCLRYAVQAAHSEQAFYGTTGDAQELVCIANYYYQLSNKTGGNISQPIFL